MASGSAYMVVAGSNRDTFTDALENDMLVYTLSNSQRILLGTQESGSSTLLVTSSNLGIGTSNPNAKLHIHSLRQSNISLDSLQN